MLRVTLRNFIQNSKRFYSIPAPQEKPEILYTGVRTFFLPLCNFYKNKNKKYYYPCQKFWPWNFKKKYISCLIYSNFKIRRKNHVSLTTFEFLIIKDFLQQRMAQECIWKNFQDTQSSNWRGEIIFHIF